MKLTREERTRILQGDHAALKRKAKPDVEEGDGHVLIWSRSRTVVTDRQSGATMSYPRRPLVWVMFAEPLRHRDGGWRISLEYHDERIKARFLSPAGAPAVDEEALTEDTAKGYRSSAVGAIDDLEAVDEKVLQAQRTEADERWANHREETAADEEIRRQERAMREQLKQAARQLPPLAAQALLAGIERQIRQALATQNEASREPQERPTIQRRRAR